jgi:hypothetical protein
LIVLQSIFTVSGLGELHLFILAPFVVIVMASFLDQLAGRSRKVAFIVVVLLVASNLGTVVSYYGALVQTGGLGDASSATYELADYLLSTNHTAPLAVDWGFSDNLPVLTSNRVKPVDIYFAGDAQRFKDTLPRFMSLNNVFLFHAPAFTVVPRFDMFEQVAVSLRKAAILEKVFLTRNGITVVLVYSVANLDSNNDLGAGESLLATPFQPSRPSSGACVMDTLPINRGPAHSSPKRFFCLVTPHEVRLLYMRTDYVNFSNIA